MTFCLGIKTQAGLVAIADTRITSGSEVSTAKKIAVHEGERHSMFVLTSGLRSVRDKAITYFEERLRQNGGHLARSYQAVNALAEEMRRVYDEDNDWLIKAGLHFDLHCIVGSQLAEDESPHLYLLYPQGNWVEVSRGDALPDHRRDPLRQTNLGSRPALRGLAGAGAATGLALVQLDRGQLRRRRPAGRRCGLPQRRVRRPRASLRGRGASPASPVLAAGHRERR